MSASLTTFLAIEFGFIVVLLIALGLQATAIAFRTIERNKKSRKTQINCK